MATIFIDDLPYEVPDGKNLLEVALSLGMDLTYFCWHPAMHSVGACRQCAVLHYRDENDKRGKIVMACMQEANNGMRFSIKDKRVHDFRAGNIESLMINHPHDCPVCDEGGECHLQDMTVMSGHNYRRYRFKKRTHINQNLGPFVNHEMNRCIQCYRCVRFYNDYAGGTDFGVFASNGRVYFGRSEDGTLENEFSGNLVEVCPTGVFTDKTLRQHYTRKWDLTSAPSVCHGCSVGCNTLASERYGSVRRIMSRFNGDVNGYFICDRGRFGYEYANSKSRLTACAQKDGQPDTAFKNLQDHIASKPQMIGIGSPRASLESNFMLKKLVGDENFYIGIPESEGKCVDTTLEMLKTSGVRTPSLAEIEKFDAVFVLGEDVTNTAPMIALALRQAAKTAPREEAYKLRIPHWNDAAIREVVQNQTGPFFLATPYATKLDEIATASYTGNTASLLELVEMIQQALSDKGTQDSGDKKKQFAQHTAQALMAAKKPLIVSGTGMMSQDIIRAAAALASALKSAGKEAGLTYAVPHANSLGVAMIGGRYFEDAIEAAKKSNKPTAIIVETNLFHKEGTTDAETFLSHCGIVVVADSLENETTPHADYILPAGTFAESSGTFVNNEGRAQRYYQVHIPKYDIKSSWAWIDMLANQSADSRVFDLIVDEMVASNPLFEPIRTLAPKADFRIGTQKIPRETHRYSGRTAMNANISVHEPKPPVDLDSPLSYTMEGFHGQPPSADTPYFWSPGWNSVQSINKYQIEVGGELHGGNPGKRLLEPTEGGSTQTRHAATSSSSNEGFEVMPAYHIYGSDELTSLSPALAKRIPPAYIAINESSLKKSGLENAQSLTIKYKNNNITLPVQINNSLPENMLLIPYGFKETRGISYPFRTNVG